MRRILLLLFCAVAALSAAAKGEVTLAPHAALIDLDGPIGPATSGYFDKAQRRAIESGAGLILLRIDTPGGLDGAMRDIIKDILASPVPVVAWVGPDGARAASAGVYILYASHLAAMAPATNLGAATPVQIGGSSPVPASDKPKKDSKDKPAQDPPEPPSGDAMQKKIVNDAVAYLRSLAALRGRNADWAERAVREGASLPAPDALKQKVIDLVAADLPELLRKIDGRTLQTASGTVTLKTAGMAIEPIKPDWRFRFLAIITNPTIAYLLMLAGIYGLLLEGYHPGAVLPGVVGAICLLLALFAFQLLPVNYVGLALILLGVVLMIAEALAPTFGALGFGGVIAFVFGSILLMDIDVPGYGVNRGIIGGIAIGASGLLGLTLYLLYRARRSPVTTGDAVALGHVVEITEFESGQGWAKLGGERWRVVSTAALQPGQRARVRRVDGLTLTVDPE